MRARRRHGRIRRNRPRRHPRLPYPAAVDVRQGRRGGSGRRRSRASRPLRSGCSSGSGLRRRRRLLHRLRAVAVLGAADEVEDPRDAGHGDDARRGRAGRRPASSTYRENTPVSEHVLRERLGRLSLEQKVRLLTGADFWALHDEPAIGLRRLVTSDGPAGVRGERWDEREPSANVPSPTLLAATWDEARIERLGAPAGLRGARARASTSLLAPMVNLHRTPYGGRHFESLQRGPAADRPDRRRLRARAAGRGRRRDGQALRGQRLRDRALHARRAGRRAGAARAVPGAVRGDRARRRRVDGDGRLQRASTARR